MSPTIACRNSFLPHEIFDIGLNWRMYFAIWIYKHHRILHSGDIVQRKRKLMCTGSAHRMPFTDLIGRENTFMEPVSKMQWKLKTPFDPISLTRKLKCWFTELCDWDMKPANKCYWNGDSLRPKNVLSVLIRSLISKQKLILVLYFQMSNYKFWGKILYISEPGKF